MLFLGTLSISYSIRMVYYINGAKTWQEAQSYCRANFIDMMTVDYKGAEDLCASLVAGSGSAAWIGLKRTWAWSAGGSLNSQYAPWSSGYPVEENATGKCALFDGTGWQDAYCSESFNTFCFDGNLIIFAGYLCQNIFYTSDLTSTLQNTDSSNETG